MASGDAEATIGVWTRESPHNYENNLPVTIPISAARILSINDSQILWAQWLRLGA